MAGRDLLGVLLRHEPPRRVEQPDLHQLGDGVDEPGAAQALGLDVADDLQGHVVAEPDDLDGAVGGAHAAPDRAALEGRARRGRGRDDPVAVGQHDLAVGADVDEEPRALVAVEPAGEHAGHDVAADVGPERGEEEGPRPRVDGEAELGRVHGREGRRRHDERRDTDRLGVDAEHQRGHRGVAGQRHLVDVLQRDAALLAHLGGQLAQRRLRRPPAAAAAPADPSSSRRCG